MQVNVDLEQSLTLQLVMYINISQSMWTALIYPNTSRIDFMNLMIQLPSIISLSVFIPIACAKSIFPKAASSQSILDFGKIAPVIPVLMAL